MTNLPPPPLPGPSPEPVGWGPAPPRTAPERVRAAWEQADTRELADELRPAFERIASSMATRRAVSGEFRDPTLSAVIALLARGIVEVVAFILLDGDLVKHDYAEGAIEHELAGIYGRLGTPLTPPDPGRSKGRHSYGGRIAATIFSFGIYSLWWERDVMNEGNRHFRHNWVWEDNLAGAVRQLVPAA